MTKASVQFQMEMNAEGTWEILSDDMDIGSMLAFVRTLECLREDHAKWAELPEAFRLLLIDYGFAACMEISRRKHHAEVK